MPKNKLVYGIVAVFILASNAGLSYSKVENGPEDITMVDQNSIKPKPATFPHWKHQEEITCGKCHHSMDSDLEKIEYNEGQEIGQCSSCHNRDTLAGRTLVKLGNKKPIKLDTIKDAVHANCIPCHKKTRKRKLSKCDTCHPKKKG